MRRLDDFINIHKGQRAFIACNGPHLNDIPVEMLNGEIVFGLNRGYRKKGLPITYLVVMVKSIIKQWGDEIIKVNCDTLFTNHLDAPHACRTPFGGVGKIFQTDLTKNLFRGNTVTFVAMQLAYGMGFDEVICIGLDHHFVYDNTVRDKSHRRMLINKGDDLNHFDPDYFGDGAKWLPAELNKSEEQYKMARRAFENDGRRLLNASTFTKLPESAIPRVRFNDII